MKTIRAFMLGIIEFRSSFTTNVGFERARTYDMGRDLAHRLTFRYFDH